MNRSRMAAYGICAITVSNIHLHYMMIDAWRQRKKEKGENKNGCFWKK